MFVSDCLGLNGMGHLTIGGRDTVELAEIYGTPLYVMDENEIRKACTSYRESKAFCCKAMCKIAIEEQIALDVVSLGELHTAESVGFPPEQIYFHGNNKTVAELRAAIEYGVGQIVVDNLNELDILNALSISEGKKTGILLRVKPGVDAHTHKSIHTCTIIFQVINFWVRL